MKLIYSSDTSTKREAAILKISPPAFITSAEVIIAEYDAIFGQWEREDFYNHLSNYTNNYYSDNNNNFIYIAVYTGSISLNNHKLKTKQKKKLKMHKKIIHK